MASGSRRKETPEEQADRVLADFDRMFVTWRGHTFLRNTWLFWFLAGLPVGVLLAAGLAIAGRGGLVVVTLLQLALLLLPVVFLVLFLVSLAARRWGRGAAFRAVHLWGGCLGALVVLKIATAFLDSGMRDVL